MTVREDDGKPVFRSIELLVQNRAAVAEPVQTAALIC